jgi:hypothetical protein
VRACGGQNKGSLARDAFSGVYSVSCAAELHDDTDKQTHGERLARTVRKSVTVILTGGWELGGYTRRLREERRGDDSFPYDRCCGCSPSAPASPGWRGKAPSITCLAPCRSFPPCWACMYVSTWQRLVCVRGIAHPAVACAPRGPVSDPPWRAAAARSSFKLLVVWPG